MSKYSTEENRRQAVRVDDRIMLSVRKISSQRFKNLASDFVKGVSLYNQDQMGQISLYLGAHAALSKIRETDANLADFLQHIDNKVNRILSKVSGQASPIDNLQTLEVNISGSGVAFPTEDIYRDGEYAELVIVLLPESTHIYTIARVVACDLPPLENADEEDKRTAVEFVLLMDEDRENLIQHIFKRQHLALKNKRKQEED